MNLSLAGLCLLSPLLVAGARAPQGTLELIETAPVETSLDDPALREFAAVWEERIDAAQRSLELAFFYASAGEGGRLQRVLERLEAAAERGVEVRFLLDERFCETYPETAARLEAAAGIELRRFDMRALTGGVMHAKYLVADGEWVVLGSANFDWRSLEHIQELGLVMHSQALAATYREVFGLDWGLAAGTPRPVLEPESASRAWPLELEFGGEPVRVWPALSPVGLVPDEELLELPRLVRWIGEARERVSVQVLTYRTVGYGGDYFGELEEALRAAAARGVAVRLLVADWGKRRGTIEGLNSLQLITGIEVRMVTVPPAAAGHIPFARFVHSKCLEVDGARAWVGSSNWEGSYFYKGRNVGLFVEGRPFASAVAGRFESTWTSGYATPVDPCVDYEVPRIGD